MTFYRTVDWSLESLTVVFDKLVTAGNKVKFTLCCFYNLITNYNFIQKITKTILISELDHLNAVKLLETYTDLDVH